MSRAWTIGVAPLMLAACVGSIDLGPTADEGGAAGPGAGRAAGPEATKGSGAGTGGSTPGAELEPARPRGCDGPLSVGRNALARLTAVEYNNTLRDLLRGLSGATAIPTQSLPEESRVNGFDNNAEAQTTAFALADRYNAAAGTLARLVAASPAALAPCAGSTPAQQEACGADLVQRFGKRAFRRPLTSDELGRWSGFFKRSLAAYGYDTAVRLTVQAFLQAPQLLYRIEIGVPAPGTDLRRLTTHELASRLAYLLTDSMPDAALMAAADEGRLVTVAELGAQAERLLMTPAARAAVARFHDQWLEIHAIDGLMKNPRLFPAFDEAVTDALRDAVAAFVDRAFFGAGARIERLLADTTAFVNDKVAPLYGTTSTGRALQAIDLETVPSQRGRRAGLLTQAGWLAARAGFEEDSPIHRGVYVRERLLCAPPPPPPPEVNDTTPVNEPGQAPRTVRQRLEQVHQARSDCGACHRLFDGLGFAFGHYDAIGRWRDRDSGQPVDARGTFDALGIEGLSGAFDGAVDLARQLATSRRVADCVATQWFRYAFGRTESAADSCTVRAASERLAATGGDMRDLLLTLVRSEAFRHREAITP